MRKWREEKDGRKVREEWKDGCWESPFTKNKLNLIDQTD